MQVILNEKGYVTAYALVGSFASGYVEVNDPSDVNDFEQNYRSYCLADGVLVKSDDRQKEIAAERELISLRSQREKACFPYINRGYLWYSKLTKAQKTELSSWYQAWLDITETKIVPETPAWLNSKGGV